MPTMKPALLCMAAILTLAACSEPKNPAKEPPQVKSAIPQAQLDALQKAKNVESVIHQGAEREREQSEQQ